MTNAQARVEDDVAMLHKVFQGDFGSKEYFDAMNVWNEACGSITRSLDAIIHKMQEEVAALAHTSGDASDAATQVGSVVRGLPI
ncbi:hypothetical protein AB0M54_40190 [Actinoplanes sp. NPDC051470]|uniref:hypothetical protein n=1 Tax=unclassified Actinoplanes TaxID=2626549 RepID=UPI00343E44F4